jgi:hypothetical protein
VLRDLYLWGRDDGASSFLLSWLRVKREELGGEGNVVAGSGGRHVECG